MLTAIDFNLNFTYVLAGWEGPTHDTTILADSMSRPNRINIPKSKFYLEDASYGYGPGMLPPIRKTGYLLNDFTSRNNPHNVNGLFNLKHSSFRVTVERAFAALKNRFKILD